YLIHRLPVLGVDPATLMQRWHAETDVTVQRALLLGLGEFSDTRLPPAARQPLTARLLDAYREHPDPGVHAAAGWLLRERWGQKGTLERIDRDLAAPAGKLAGPVGERRWWVNSQGQTFAL